MITRSAILGSCALVVLAACSKSTEVNQAAANNDTSIVAPSGMVVNEMMANGPENVSAQNTAGATGTSGMPVPGENNVVEHVVYNNAITNTPE